MRRALLVGLCASATLLGGEWTRRHLAHAQGRGGDPAVARVGNQVIPQSEFELMRRQFESAVERESGQQLTPEDRPNFNRLVLEQLIRSRLLRAEGRRLGLQVTRAEIDRFLREQPGFTNAGKFDAARWQAFTADANAYGAATAAARDVLVGSKLFDRKGREFTLSTDAARRRLAERGQGAELRVLPLDPSWFETDPAPDANALRAHFERVRSRFHSPARARVRVVLLPFASGPVQDPPEDDRRRTQARAESLITAVRGGTPFDSAAVRFGGARTDEWFAGRKTGVFFLDPELGNQALTVPPGSVLQRALRLPGGYGVVQVEGIDPPSTATLAQVAADVRTDWAQDAVAERTSRLVREMRRAYPDSFRAPCVTWRAAIVDTAVHRGNKGRELAEKVAKAWGRGKRDRGAERKVTLFESIRTVGEAPAPLGVPPALRAPVTGAAAPSAGVVDFGGGLGVWGVVERQAACELTDEEAAGVAERLGRQAEEVEIERHARARYEANPAAYPAKPTYHYTFTDIRIPTSTIIDIPRERVEQYYHDHPLEFGTIGRVRVRQLLVYVAPGADTTAPYVRARALLARAQGGEDFEKLVREHSDDPITKAKGGDTDWFTHGMTGPGFERAAFAVQPGEVVGPVRSEFGYHLIQGWEREEEKLPPLRLAYPFAADAVAREISDSLSWEAADSMQRVVKSAREIMERAERRKFIFGQSRYREGELFSGPAIRPDIQAALREMKAPGLVPGGPHRDGDFWAVIWLDSIVTPSVPSWEEAREAALADARQNRARDAAVRAAERLRDELAQGAAWDSAAGPWGAGATVQHRRGVPLTGVLTAATLDSLLYGPAALADGRSTVVMGEHGPVVVMRVRATSGGEATAEQVEAYRRAYSERAFYDYFETLKKRHKVTILREDLNRPVAAPPEV